MTKTAYVGLWMAGFSLLTAGCGVHSSHVNSPSPGHLSASVIRRPQGIVRIDMVTKIQGWAVVNQGPYQQLWHTVSAGSRWSNVTPRGASTRGGFVPLFASSTHAWVAFLPFDLQRLSLIDQTTNGGRQWSPSILPVGLVATSQPLAYASPKQIWAIGRSGLAHSPDNGTTWRYTKWGTKGLPSHRPNDAGISFRSMHEGWLTGQNSRGVLPWSMITKDGGHHWRPYTLPHPQGLNGTFVTNPPV